MTNATATGHAGGADWDLVYLRAAETPRAELVAALALLSTTSTAEIRAAYDALGFHVPYRSRAAAFAKIHDRILQRHDTAERVRLGLR